MLFLLPLVFFCLFVAFAVVGVAFTLAKDYENRFALWIFVPIIAGILYWALLVPYLFIVTGGSRGLH